MLHSIVTPIRAVLELRLRLLPLGMGIVGLSVTVAVVVHVISAVSRNAMMLFANMSIRSPGPGVAQLSTFGVKVGRNDM
jgi:hypothetical protein